MKSICVYLGANAGFNKELPSIVKKLGEKIAQSNIRLVYGGSKNGLMGILGNAVLEHEGDVTGIICKSILEKEEPLPGITKLITTDTIQERKILMQQQADAFIIVPGGLGTLEETIETMNAIKVGTISKPLAFLNINNYFDGLFGFIKHCTDMGFINPSSMPNPIMSRDPSEIVESLLKELMLEATTVPSI